MDWQVTIDLVWLGIGLSSRAAEAELGFGYLGYASLVLVLGEVALLFTECRQLNFFILLTAEILV